MADKETIRMIECALLRINRNLGTRGLGRAKARKLEGLVDFSHLAVVDTLGLSEDKTESVTVGQIARRVELDHSRASRMVTAAIRAGYAKRIASQEDGRRTCVALTEKGEEFASAIGHLRHRYFATRLKLWSDEECRQFAGLLAKFADGAKHDFEDDETDAPGSASTGNVVALRPNLVRKTRRRQRLKRG